jgi:hypothetical protein
MKWSDSKETVAQDLKFAVRQLRKNPGFAATAILILALRDWGQRGDFCVCGCGADQAAAVSESDTPDCGEREYGAFSAQQSLVCGLPGLEADEHGFQLAGCVYRKPIYELEYADRHGAGGMGRVSAGFFRNAWDSRRCWDGIFAMERMRWARLQWCC